MSYYDAEFIFWMSAFAAAGAAAIVYKIKWVIDERRIQREDHRAYMAAAVAAKEREQEYKCRMMMFRTWDEVSEMRKRKNCGGSRNIKVVGVHSGAYANMNKTERAMVVSGITAVVNEIRENKRIRQIGGNNADAKRYRDHG